MLRTFAFGITLALPQIASAQEVRTVSVRGNVHMLMGQGGNIGLSIGKDGVFLIDDQFAPMTGGILTAIAALSKEPVRFVVNTHWHNDHTGGNENLGRRGAALVAHENVRKRMSVEQLMEFFGRKIPPSPKGALPVITFNDRMNFHWNDDDVHIFHVAHAHTDGDAIVHFTKDDVIHMGDVYFNGVYPFIDSSSGGGIDGVIAAVDRVLAMTRKDTKIIPGHGPLSGVAELKAYHAMLKTMRGRIQDLRDQGKSDDEIVAAKPTGDHDKTWGKGFMKPDNWVRIVLMGLRKQEERAKQRTTR